MIKHRKKIIIGVPSIVIFIVTWLFIGLYEDREWSDSYIFIKHRPSFKIIFYSPLGEADQSDQPGHEGYLSPEQNKEELLYIEFIEKYNGYKKSIYLSSLLGLIAIMGAIIIIISIIFMILRHCSEVRRKA